MAASALENARHLAKHVRQIRGVHLAFKPRSPILVLLLPRSLTGSRSARRRRASWRVCTPSSPVVSGSSLTPDMTTVDITRYAAILEQIISQEA